LIEQIRQGMIHQELNLSKIFDNTSNEFESDLWSWGSGKYGKLGIELTEDRKRAGQKTPFRVTHGFPKGSIHQSVACGVAATAVVTSKDMFVCLFFFFCSFLLFIYSFIFIYFYLLIYLFIS